MNISIDLKIGYLEELKEKMKEKFRILGEKRIQLSKMNYENEDAYLLALTDLKSKQYTRLCVINELDNEIIYLKMIFSKDKNEKEMYWLKRMRERRQLKDEVNAIINCIKGFYLDSKNDYFNIVEFVDESKYILGNKNRANSVAYLLGWDNNKVLCYSCLPEWVEGEALKILEMACREIIEDYKKDLD